MQHVFIQVMPADVEFIRKHSSGYICVGMQGSTLDRLHLPLMVIAALPDADAMHALSRHRPISLVYYRQPRLTCCMLQMG